MNPTIPNSPEAEQALLSRCLLDKDEALEALNLISIEDIFDPFNQRVLKAIYGLIAQNKTLDFITVKEEMGDDVKISDLVKLQGGGLSYRTSLKELCQVIKDKANARKVLILCGELQEAAMRGDSQVIETMVSKVMEVNSGQKSQDLYSAKELTNWYFELLNQRSQGEGNPGIKFGFADLDMHTPGARPGHLILVAARPSQGKSAFSENLVTNFLSQNKNVYFVSAETSREEVMDRMIGRLTGLGHSQLVRGVSLNNQTDWEKINSTLEKFKDFPLYLQDNPSITSDQVFMEAARLRLQHRLDVVVVDYLQFLKDKVTGETDERRVAKISMTLKTIARALNVPVVATCQLNRQISQRTEKAPELSDIRQSGQIEQDADIVIGMWRGDQPNDPITNFRILKQRSGGLIDFKLRFEGEFCRFTNLASEGYYQAMNSRTDADYDWINEAQDETN